MKGQVSVFRMDDGVGTMALRRAGPTYAILSALCLLACCALPFWSPAMAQSQGMRFWSGSGGSFDYYVLSLSWSPSFCARQGERRGSAQCALGRNIGFTVHGLWPQYASGYPSNCPAGERPVQRSILNGVQDIFPDEGLARYQWRKHGACAGTDPVRYFADTRTAFRKVRIPERLKNVRQPISMQRIDIERAFAAANPGLRPEMMRVMCRSGRLQEVRICFDRNVRGFMDCGKLQRSDCGFTDVRINPPR